MFLEKIPNKKESNEKEIDVLRGEHLKEGIDPIMLCHYDNPDKFKKEMKELFPEVLDVDYYTDKETKSKDNLTNAEGYFYVISPNNEENKKTTELQNCTSIILVGRDKKTGKEISFLSHQNPFDLIGERKSKYIDDLRKTIFELKELTEEGTVDAVIVGGGNISKKKNRFTGQSFKDDYLSSVASLKEAVVEELNFSPTVLLGPNNNPAEINQNIYFDTQNRRLYIHKPEQDDNKLNRSFNSNKAKEESKKWDIE